VFAGVPLYTRDGGYVTTVDMPPFQLWPEGIQWGQRTFFAQGDQRGSEPPRYVEGLLWWSPPGADSLSRELSEVR
jgi:hypothetical protein